MKTLIGLSLSVAVVVAVHAAESVTLTYAGEPLVMQSIVGQSGSQAYQYPPYDSVAITGTLTLNEPLAANLVNAPIIPASVAFSDTMQSLIAGNANGDLTFYFSTDSTGKITAWNLTFIVAGNPYVTVQGPPVLTGAQNLAVNVTSNGDMEFVTSACAYAGYDGAQPMCTQWSVAPKGGWNQTALAPVTAKVLQCSPSKVIAPSMTAVINVSPNISGSPSECKAADTVPSTWYVKTTTNGGGSWEWVDTLAQLGL